MKSSPLTSSSDFDQLPLKLEKWEEDTSSSLEGTCSWSYLLAIACSTCLHIFWTELRECMGTSPYEHIHSTALLDEHVVYVLLKYLIFPRLARSINIALLWLRNPLFGATPTPPIEARKREKEKHHLTMPSYILHVCIYIFLSNIWCLMLVQFV